MADDSAKWTVHGSRRMYASEWVNVDLDGAHAWFVSDSPVAVQTRSGRRVGESLAEAIEARVIELRHLDDVVGSKDLLPAISKGLSELESLVRNASYAEPIGVRLLTAVGELSQLAGWVASDAGRHADAQRAYLSGASAAETAGNDPLVAQLFSTLSYQVANVGNPVDALLLARSAVRGADGATPVVRALLVERLAWASAKSRDRESTMRALDAVDDAYENRSLDIPEPEWVYWLNRAEIDVMAGRCLIELSEPAKGGAAARRGGGDVSRRSLPRSSAVPVMAGGGLRPDRRTRRGTTDV